LIQLAPDVRSLDGPSGPAQDFTDLHAWCEVFIPGAGWIGLDPTSGLLAGEGHIPLSCTPEPSSAAPVTGAIDKCKTTLRHEMGVARIHESPRVTKPYSEAQWKAMEQLGHAIDRDLSKQDVRLTMGGEPTFVSIDESRNYGATFKEAKVLISAIARVLGVTQRHILPAYEDIFYYTWKERRLPSNVTPEDSHLKDELERDRLARVFQKGLGEAVG